MPSSKIRWVVATYTFLLYFVMIADILVRVQDLSKISIDTKSIIIARNAWHSSRLFVQHHRSQI